MRFTPQFLDELRARLPVSEVVGRRVKLKRAGREWKGLSPFNKEKTPSFTVNDQKGFYKDFSSGKSGDIFTFLMETDGVSFPEAVEQLAGMAGVALPIESPEEVVRDQRRRSLHDVVELAAKFFEAALAARTGAKARGYLADRGVDPSLQLKFRVGYAPSERFALKEHLGGQGVSVDDMVEAGLLVSGDDIPVPFDRFRDRVMFPICDLRGQVIAFGGRALDQDVPAKYLNSPETPLFHKGATLYNMATARAAAHQGAEVIAVEGYVDVIAMVGAGFAASVAPLGTALTAEQLALMWRMADEPILCFDGDSAGRRAAYRAVDVALPLLRPGKSLRFASLPDGQDPDDLVRAGGREAVAEVLAGARPLAQVLWMRETESGGFDTPERRAALEARVGEVTATIADEGVRRYYRQDFTERLRQLLQADAPGRRDQRQQQRWPSPRAGGRAFGRQERGRGGPPPGLRAQMGGPYVVMSPQLAASPVHRGHRAAMPRREALILQMVLNHPWLLHHHMEDLSDLEFRHAEGERLKSVLIDIFAQGAEPDRDAMAAAVSARGLSDLVDRIERSITTPSVWGARAPAARDDVLMTWNQLVALHRQWHSLIKELRDAELALGRDSTEANYSWLQDVKSRLAAVDGTEALIDGFGSSSGRSAG
jgi:DNA primase